MAFNFGKFGEAMTADQCKDEAKRLA